MGEGSKKHKARLVDRFCLSPRTVLLTFAIEGEDQYQPEDRPVFHPKGGQYVIIDTGRLDVRVGDPSLSGQTPAGKPLKRAYSLLPVTFTLDVFKKLGRPFKESSGFSIAVYRVGASGLGFGPGSHFFCDEAQEHQEFLLSGPWGRMTHEHAAESFGSSGMWKTVERTDGPSNLVVLAAGTGITGAMSLFSHPETQSFYQKAKLLWLDDGDFLSSECVRELLGEVCQELTVEKTSSWNQNQLRALLNDLKPDLGLDVAYFGDGSFYLETLKVLEDFFRESQKDKDQVSPLSIRVRKEFYYRRPVERKDIP